MVSEDTEEISSSPPAAGADDARFSPAVILASGFWFGYSPVASGTVGALWGLPLAWGIGQIGIVWQVVAIVAICLVGIPLSTAAARRLGGLKDPGIIVFDEIASMPITFFLVPLGNFWDRLDVIAVGFVLNRGFDIFKPPPARQFERWPEGLGIMADDWMAGVYSCLALHAVLWALG